MSTLYGLDYLFLIILVFSALLGIWRGFIKEMLSFLVWLIALILAYLFFSKLAGFLNQYIASKLIVNILSFLFIFLLILLVGKLLVTFLAYIIHPLNAISILDRFFGVFFGLARGVLISITIIFLFNLTHWRLQPWFTRSQSVKWAQPVIVWAKGKSKGYAMNFKLRDSNSKEKSQSE